MINHYKRYSKIESAVVKYQSDPQALKVPLVHLLDVFNVL